MKRAIAAAIVLCCLLGAAAAQPLRVGALRGPTAMGLAKMMKDGGAAFTLAGSPDALVPLIARGELDVALLPVNLAAVLYRSTGGAVRAVSVNTLGRLRVLSWDDTALGIGDLAGRKLYAAGKASTPEFVLTRLLELHGAGEPATEWKSEHSEAAAAFMADRGSLALLPEPFVSLVLHRAPETRTALDLGQLWEEAGYGPLVTGVTVARSDVLENRSSDIKEFLALQDVSQAYVNAHPDEAAAWMEELGILDAQAARLAIPGSGITYIAGDEMVALLTAFYAAMHAMDPASVGGSPPDSAFYASP